MQCTISIRTAASRQVVDDRLRQLTGGGPFRMGDLVTVGVGVWRFHLQPVRQGMVIGFGKVAELLVLLAREFEVHSVERSPVRSVAAAS